MFESLVDKALELGASDALLIDTAQIVFDARSFLKCRFGCNRWGRYWTCPPHLDISADEFMLAFQNYEKAIIYSISGPQIRPGSGSGPGKRSHVGSRCSFRLRHGSLREM